MNRNLIIEKESFLTKKKKLNEAGPWLHDVAKGARYWFVVPTSTVLEFSSVDDLFFNSHRR